MYNASRFKSVRKSLANSTIFRGFQSGRFEDNQISARADRKGGTGGGGGLLFGSALSNLSKL